MESGPSRSASVAVFVGVDEVAAWEKLFPEAFRLLSGSVEC